jgi:hypothetical protein
MSLSSILKSVGKIVLAAGAAGFVAALTNRSSGNSSDEPWTDKDCDWFCDNCGEFMNDQPGFNTVTGTWVCTNCGEENDVSEENILWEGDAPYDPELDEP